MLNLKCICSYSHKSLVVLYEVKIELKITNIISLKVFIIYLYNLEIETIDLLLP